MSSQRFNLLSQLTIFIPTYNRPLELERAIEYWRETPVNVHFLDGSKEAWFPIGSVQGAANVHYHHVPQSTEEHWQSSYLWRINLAAELADTPYSALCADDDFFTVHGLEVALENLKEGKADVVIGKCAQYLFRRGTFEWKRINWDWRANHFALSHDIWDHFADSSKGSTYYGIYNTSHWKTIRTICGETRFSHVAANENISNYLTKRALRVMLIEKYLWISNYPDKKYPDAKHKLTKFSSWLNDSSNEHEVEAFLMVLENGFKRLIPVEKHHLARFMARSILINRGAPKKLTSGQRVLTRFKQGALHALSGTPECLRRTIFPLLSKKWREVFRTSDFVDSRTPVMDIDGDDAELAEAIRNWERILLMPREELRLLAKI